MNRKIRKSDLLRLCEVVDSNGNFTTDSIPDYDESKISADYTTTDRFVNATRQQDMSPDKTGHYGYSFGSLYEDEGSAMSLPSSLMNAINSLIAEFSSVGIDEVTAKRILDKIINDYGEQGLKRD